MREDSTRADDVTLWGDKVGEAQGAKAEDEAKLAATVLSYESDINDVNTGVANIEAQLQQAQFYLENTTLRAPEDGRIVNLQVRPGMVAGILRIGGIAALIATADRYVLATYFQENLKYVRPGQFAELSFNLYPGQIFKGHVDSIWKANGAGQYLPSDEIPKYEPPAADSPAGAIRSEDHRRRSRRVKISDRRAGRRGHLHGRRSGRLGGAAQNRNPLANLAGLALSALKQASRTKGTER